ncbi:MAG: hypothetical protein ACPGUC_00830 [Gammaproteobacteria bacterium]
MTTSKHTFIDVAARWALGLMLASAVTAAPVHAEGGESALPGGCLVELDRGRATLSFPAAYGDETWTRNQSNTPSDGLEYAFEVLFRNEGRTTGVGFYTFKDASAQVSGAPEAFFETGRVVAWRHSEEGRELISTDGITVAERDGRVVFEVTHLPALKAMFSDAPRAALFSTQHPDPKLSYGCVAGIAFREYTAQR